MFNRLLQNTLGTHKRTLHLAIDSRSEEMRDVYQPHMGMENVTSNVIILNVVMILGIVPHVLKNVQPL